MQQVDAEAALAVQPELTPGENIVWAGRPVLTIIFHHEDAILVPFSLFWGGFAIFWEAMATGWLGRDGRPGVPSPFLVLWGIPFVLAGQHFIWGRFLYAAWKKKRTYYAVTNRRVIAVQTKPARRVACSYIDTLSTLTKESGPGATGTLRFVESPSVWSRTGSWSAWDSMAVGSIPAFVDVEDANALYLLVSELREKSAASRRS